MAVDYNFSIASPVDGPAISELYWRGLNTEEKIDEVRELITEYPAIKVLSNDALVGFAYSKYFAPDILEIENIFVDENHRNNGIGALLLHKIEHLAAKQYSAIILTNSTLYENAVVGKRPASTFYLANGYTAAIETGPSTVFVKKL